MTHLDVQRCITDDFDIDILMMSSGTILIAKFNGSKYKQWSGEMALPLEQKQVYGMVTAEVEHPYDTAADAAAPDQLAHQAGVNDLVKLQGTARSMILLDLEPRLEASYIEITHAQRLWEILATAYMAKLKFNVFQIREGSLGLRLKDHDVDAYALQIDQKVKNYNLFSEPLSLNGTRTLAKMTPKEHVFHLLRSLPRNDNWQFFPELIIDKNAMATVMPDEMVIKLVEDQATIKRDKGLGQEALPFVKGNAKGKGKGK